MRILLLSNLYPPAIQGGAEILAADVVAGLEVLGHEVIVLTSSQGTPEPRKDGKIRRTLHSAPPTHFDQRRPAWQQLKLLVHYFRRYHSPGNARELERVVAASQPEVLYIWEITGIGVNSLLKKLPRLPVPVVFHLGSYWMLYAGSPETKQSRLHIPKLKRWLIGTISFPKDAKFIAVSETVKKEYVRAGLDRERIEVIYNGIDPRFLSLPHAKSAAGDTNGTIQLLFVGRLRVEKGVLVLLQALELLVNGKDQSKTVMPPMHLNIFGSGDPVYHNELQAFLHQKGLAQAVTFHGNVSQDELIEYYDCSDMLLVPSLWQEPFGLVVVEAMARGLPVIASRLGGPAEILTDQVNGLLVRPGDERALALAIGELVENPDKRTQFSRAARANVQEHFTIEKSVKHIEQYLRNVVQERKRL